MRIFALFLLIASGNLFADEPELLKVMTLNVAHARADGANQLLQSTDEAKSNLWQIIDVLNREKPHVAAFQEIDSNSFWNGRFNHTAFLAEGANYPHHFSGSHIDGNRLQYGTAIVAQLALREPSSIKFKKPFARLGKGFVVSTARWPGSEDIDVDIVSVHFDFLTGNQRLKEAMKLIETIKGRINPRVIMGDLNSEYGADSQLIPLLEDSLGLSTWQPHVEVVTFPKLQKRLDWVLVSRDIEIVTHEVLPDTLSDHRAIVAELRLL
jgi:endonuclease/exonuclease/phosphatase family metal-dependent hydrolase